MISSTHTNCQILLFGLLDTEEHGALLLVLLGWLCSRILRNCPTFFEVPSGISSSQRSLVSSGKRSRSQRLIYVTLSLQKKWIVFILGLTLGYINALIPSWISMIFIMSLVTRLRKTAKMLQKTFPTHLFPLSSGLWYVLQSAFTIIAKVTCYIRIFNLFLELLRQGFFSPDSSEPHSLLPHIPHLKF